MSPAAVLGGAVLWGCVLVALALWTALRQPQIDLPPGAVPLQLGQIPLIDSDLIDEPDQLGSYAAIQDFRVRQTALRAELGAGEVAVRYALPDGSTGADTFAVRARGIGDLPWPFWFQIGVGLVSLLIGAWVISLRREDWGARMFALTAVFVPVFAYPAAVYSTRQIALDGALFHWLSSLNAFGAISFGIALVGLFSQYPKPMFRPVWLLIPLAVYGTAIVLNAANLPPDNILGLAVLSQMLIAVILGAVQWFRSRREPLNRAGLRWFILVSLVGCSLFIVLVPAPVALGVSEGALIPQGIAFAFFNIMHIGLALGVLRYKVFNLDRWSYYIWLWLSGMILIIVLDVALIRLLQDQPWVSLGVALLIAGFLYFPLRQILLRLLLTRRSASLKGRMAAIVNTALAPTHRAHAQRWDALLVDVFAPLAPPERMAQAVSAPQIAENGLALLIPGLDGLEPRRLRYAQMGRRLFSRDDLDVVANMVEMHELAADSRRAYERGATLERDRISKDVHDNIGAQLLTALHSPEVSRKDDLLRDSLKDLRAIINDGFRAEYPLMTMLADLRTETVQRLEVQGLTLHWEGPEDIGLEDGPTISFDLVNGLRSILREAVSNVLRHSDARNVHVVFRLEGDVITLVVEDDGKGLAPRPGSQTGPGAQTDPGSQITGNGIPNILERAQVLSGTGTVANRTDGTSGTRVEVVLSARVDRMRREAAQ